ncbi:hypothetical protein B566_EDAN000993 [Ephemera danica]|nr:hypothetical protein B566_EDAN000993 [Ephemera danica]
MDSEATAASGAVDENNPGSPVITRLCDLQHYVDLQHSGGELQSQQQQSSSCVKSTNSNPTASETSSPSVLQTSSETKAPIVESCVKSVPPQLVSQSSAPLTRSATSNLANCHATQTAPVVSGSSRSEGTQAILDHPVKACNITESPSASHSATKRTYSTISEHSLEYQPFKAKSVKPKLLEQQADINLERKLRQEAMEKELRLQKSLSEECEDLGVDEPSTSDLFPEADLLLDPHPGLNFDSSAADASCSQTVDSNDQFPCSDARSADSTSNLMDCLQYSTPNEIATNSANTQPSKRKTDNISRYSCTLKRYSSGKSGVLRGCSPSCADTNGSKLMPCKSHQSLYTSSSGEDSLNVGASLSNTSSPICEPFEPSQSTTKSPDSQQEKPLNAFSSTRRVGQTYGKKVTKSNNLKKKGGGDTSSADNTCTASRPFASVSIASKQGQDTPTCQPQSSSSSKVVSCSANGTDKSRDAKESAEAKDNNTTCRIVKKRKSSEVRCDKPCSHAVKRLTRCTRSFSGDALNADDDDQEGADEDVDTDGPQSTHEDTCESQTSQTYGPKSGEFSSDSNPWSVGSCKSPDVSQSSPLPELQSGCSQRLALRSSLRGRRVKKNCSCCNGSPERKIPRTNKLFKKGANGKSVIKGHMLKKR